MAAWPEFFLKGAIVGFCIAAPVGPVGILCIQRTLHFGRWSGFSSGLGAASADTIYGIIAALSLTFIAEFLAAQRSWIQIVGGVFLLFVGARIFFSKPKEKIKGIERSTFLSDFFSTFFLTLTNPMTILSFIAIFATLRITVQPTALHEIFLVLGVSSGSALWWFLLSEGITLFRKKVTHKAMVWINRIAGLTILFFGFVAILYS